MCVQRANVPDGVGLELRLRIFKQAGDGGRRECYTQEAVQMSLEQLAPEASNFTNATFD